MSANFFVHSIFMHPPILQKLNPDFEKRQNE